MDEPEIKPAYLIIALLIAALAFTLGYSANSGQTTRTIIVQSNNQTGGVNSGASIAINSTILEPLEKIALLLPGVDSQGKGAIATLEIERTNGTGRTFINLDENRPAILEQTQASVKNAVHVAKNFDELTSTRFSQSDLLLVFKANSLELSGGSAGAATAISAIALLNGRKIKAHFAITGTINPNGSIGVVGEVLEKARALKQAGVTTFLVPVGEAVQRTNVANSSENCTEETIQGGVFRSCTTQTNIEPLAVNVSREVGINVVEVGDIGTAYGIMAE